MLGLGGLNKSHSIDLKKRILGNVKIIDENVNEELK